MMNNITIRNSLLRADIQEIVFYHDRYYTDNYGFNHDFGKYVLEPLTDFYTRNSEHERIWVIEECGLLKGCIALVKVSDEEAQLRWFYVDESIRGKGFGQELIGRLIDFAVGRNYQRINLWTVSLLEEAARLYLKNGFILEEEHEAHIWGRDLVEQKYVKRL